MSEYPEQDWSRPKVVTDLELAFPTDISNLLPPYDYILERFDPDTSPFCDLADTWFFKGLNAQQLVPKPGIVKGTALRHLKAVMGSWTPKHEHKISAVGYLLSLWFEEPPANT